jgi:nucleoside-diphosphate-sugar epimerase
VAAYFCSKGVEVHCGVRASGNLSYLNTLPVKTKVIDLLNPDTLYRAIAQTDFVIHTAAMVNDWASYREFHDVNVTGTRNVMNACAEAGIADVIVTGSCASYGEEDSKEIKSEDSPAKPRYPYFLEKLIPNRLNYYRITKHMATCEAEQIARENNMNLTVIEPVWVYGEREFSSGFYEYMKVAGSGIPYFPGSRKNKFHVIYAGDLARAYYQVFEKRPSGVNRILAGNAHIDRMEKIYACFCKEMGIKKPANLPWAMVYPIGLILEVIAELLKSKNPPLLSRSRVNMMYDNIEYSTRKAEELIAFRAELPIETGISRTVEWYRKNNLLNYKS